MTHPTSKIAALAALAFLVPCLSTCGLILGGGSRETIQVQASPTDAKVTTSPATGDYTAPTTLNLERKTNYSINFVKEGYTPASMQIESHVRTGYVIADVLLTGLIGVVVDAATGGWSKLTPETANVTLTKVAGIDGPNTITVGLTVHRTAQANVVDVRSSDPGVTVQVTAGKQ
ncbi:MAG TPA: hypothetical protein VIC24_09765 [Gemmatimonadaceae bacterium]